MGWNNSKCALHKTVLPINPVPHQAWQVGAMSKEYSFVKYNSYTVKQNLILILTLNSRAEVSNQLTEQCVTMTTENGNDDENVIISNASSICNGNDALSTLDSHNEEIEYHDNDLHNNHQPTQ